MAYQTVTCEVYYKIGCFEFYSDRRPILMYDSMRFECQGDAERFLAEEGFTREEAGGFSWKKPSAYQYAWVTRELREIKE